MAQDKPARDALHTYEIAFPYFRSVRCSSSGSRGTSLSPRVSVCLCRADTYACVSFRGMETPGESMRRYRNEGAEGGGKGGEGRNGAGGGSGIRGRRQAAWHEERSSAPRF